MSIDDPNRRGIWQGEPIIGISQIIAHPTEWTESEDYAGDSPTGGSNLNNSMNTVYGNMYQGNERRKSFECECGSGYQYNENGKILCTKCNKVIEPKRSEDRKYIKDWVGCE